MSSDNPTGADNQQETAKSTLELDPHWVVGFVDGEGCFSVSVHRNLNARATGGWQLHPVFHVYQHERYRAVLEALVTFFGCGRLRPKGPRAACGPTRSTRLVDLEEHVVPFFERYPLVVKAADFQRFAAIVRSMRRKEHLARRRVRTARADRLRDERDGKQRAGRSKRSWRDPQRLHARHARGQRQVPSGEDTVRPSWRHGESGRNDLTTHSNSVRSNKHA